MIILNAGGKEGEKAQGGEEENSRSIPPPFHPFPSKGKKGKRRSGRKEGKKEGE